ncbi:hypothetical protein BOX15_Mlig023640g3, partial [Macrostomum lignano]
PASMPACGSRAARLQQAFFPDVASADATTTASCVNRLSAPSAALAVAVELLIDYQIDADAAADAASHLAALLVGDPSQSEAESTTAAHGAAALAALLSRKQACRLAFIDQPDLLAALLARLDCRYDDSSSSGEEAKRLSATALCHISQSERGCLAIWRCGRVCGRSAPALLLSAITDPQSLSHSLTCLRRLLASVPEARRSARPGLPLLAGLLGLADVRLLASAADCLQLLAFGDSTTKRRLLELDVQSRLAGLLRRRHQSSPTPADENLLVAAARLLRSLTVEPNGKSAVIRAGCFEALAGQAVLPGASPRLLLSCLWPLRNLSNCCCFEGSLASGLIIDLLVRLTGLLTSPDADTATCAAGLLCNLTCGSRPCKRAVVQAGGSAALTVALLSIRPGVREEFAEPLVCALRHVTRDHPLADQAAEEFFNCDGSNALLCLLSRPVKSATPADGLPCGRPLLKASLGLCRNLVALADRWRVALVNGGIVELAAAAIRLANDADEYDACGRRLSGGGLSDPDGGISAEEIQEVGLAFLAALSDAASAAAAAAKPEFLAALASLIRSRRSAVAAGAVELLDKLRLSASTTASPSLGSVSTGGSRPLLQPAALIGGWEYCGVGHRRDSECGWECCGVGHRRDSECGWEYCGVGHRRDSECGWECCGVGHRRDSECGWEYCGVGHRRDSECGWECCGVGHRRDSECGWEYCGVGHRRDSECGWECYGVGHRRDSECGWECCGVGHRRDSECGWEYCGVGHRRDSECGWEYCGVGHRRDSECGWEYCGVGHRRDSECGWECCGVGHRRDSECGWEYCGVGHRRDSECGWECCGVGHRRDSECGWEYCGVGHRRDSECGWEYCGVGHREREMERGR